MSPAPFKTPPHSLLAEQSVIGGFFLDASAFDRVQGICTETDFYRNDHRLIFAAVAQLSTRKQPVDVVTVADFLTQQGHLDEAGGLAYLGTIAKDTPSAANIIAYAKIVRDKSLLRQLLTAVSDIQESVYQQTREEVSILLRAAEERLFRLVDASQKGTRDVQSMQPVLNQLLIHMHEQAKNTEPNEQLLGLSTGFSKLNELLSGLIPGDLVVVAARPSMGKTAFCGDLELAVAAQGKPVLSFSLEMPTEQLVMRHLSRSSSVSLQHIRKTWKMSEADWPRIADAVKPLSEYPIYFVDKAGISPSEIRAIARRVHRDCVKKHGVGLGLITIDYLQLMQADVGQYQENRATEVGCFSRSLKGLAKELSVPVVALSQLNRSVESRPNKRPVMADIRESGAIEQDADSILFIYRDEVYHPNSSWAGSAEIIIAKQRNGPIGTVRLAWEGLYTRFRDFKQEYAAYE